MTIGAHTADGAGGAGASERRQSAETREAQLYNLFLTDREAFFDWLVNDTENASIADLEDDLAWAQSDLKLLNDPSQPGYDNYIDLLRSSGLLDEGVEQYAHYLQLLIAFYKGRMDGDNFDEFFSLLKAGAPPDEGAGDPVRAFNALPDWFRAELNAFIADPGRYASGSNLEKLENQLERMFASPLGPDYIAGRDYWRDMQSVFAGLEGNRGELPETVKAVFDELLALVNAAAAYYDYRLGDGARDDFLQALGVPNEAPPGIPNEAPTVVSGRTSSPFPTSSELYALFHSGDHQAFYDRLLNETRDASLEDLMDARALAQRHLDGVSDPSHSGYDQLIDVLRLAGMLDKGIEEYKRYLETLIAFHDWRIGDVENLSAFWALLVPMSDPLEKLENQLERMDVETNPVGFLEALMAQTEGWSNDDYLAAIADLQAQYAAARADRGLGESDEIKAFEAVLAFFEWKAGVGSNSAVWEALGGAQSGPPGSVPMSDWQIDTAENDPYAFYIYIGLHTAGWSQEELRDAIADLQAQYAAARADRGLGESDEIKAFEAARAFLEWQAGDGEEAAFWDALGVPPMGPGDFPIGPIAPPDGDEPFLALAYRVFMEGITNSQRQINEVLYGMERRNERIDQLRAERDAIPDTPENQKARADIQREIDSQTELSTMEGFNLKKYQNNYQNYTMLLDALIQVVKDLVSRIANNIRA